ncbi:MAG: hypothetical protein VX527_05130, partial [Planctomycetota bacterium]|nr:hypothetical protein [Planctomycetota bacterium]
DLYQSDIGINTYIFNADVVLQSLRDLGLFPPGNAPQGDAYGTWYVDDEWWDQTVRNFHDQIRTDLEHWYHPSSLQEKKGNLPPSIRDLYTEFPVANCPSIDRLAERARKRPDVEFYFLMAPFPVEYYLYQSKEDIAALIGMRRYAADLFDQLPNVQLHAFDHDECIVGDLGRYKDLMHYHPSVNRHMIECIANNSNILNSKSIDLHEQHWLTLLQQYQKRYMK